MSFKISGHGAAGGGGRGKGEGREEEEGREEGREEGESQEASQEPPVGQIWSQIGAGGDSDSEESALRRLLGKREKGESYDTDLSHGP